MKKLLLLPLTTLFILMTFSPSDPTLAASAQQLHTQAHQIHTAPFLPTVTCSGNGCTGLDPIATGCSASASTVLSTVIFRDSINGLTPLATINLRFSSVCKTNWAQLVSSIGSAPLQAVVRRENGVDGSFVTECEPTSCLGTITATSAYTNMVWAPDVAASAEGWIYSGGTKFYGCVTQDSINLPC